MKILKKVFTISTENNPQCFLKFLLCSRYSVKPCAYVISLHPHNNPIKSFKTRRVGC